MVTVGAGRTGAGQGTRTVLVLVQVRGVNGSQEPAR